MPSTYSNLLGLENQATGENSATWGDIVDTTHELPEDAIAGRLLKSVAGAADVTLTDNDGAADEHRNMIHEFTGALTGNINVIVPDTSKLYFVYNNTSGSYTLTVKTSTGTGVAVPQGGREALYSDGTNIVRATTHLVSAVLSSVTISSGSISGITDLAVADGGTGASTAADARTNLDAEQAGVGIVMAIALG